MKFQPFSVSGSPANRAWPGIAQIAGGFCVILTAALLYQHLTATTNDPWKSPQLLALKAKLQAAPKDEKTKEQIRALDLKYRQRFFRRLSLDQRGGWMLLGGFAVFLMAANRAAAGKRKPPMPEPNPNAEQDARRQTALARKAVMTTGISTAVFLIVIAAQRVPLLPATPEALQKSLGGEAAVQEQLPSLAEFQANWPRFRGPDGSGFSKETNLPVSWDSKAGTGIVWKAPIPAPGFNSPLVWGNLVFISGGTAAKREVFCYDAAEGHLVWQRAVENVPGSPGKAPEISEQTGYAASTMATDGRRVYAIFATGDLAAFTMDGTPVWSKNLGVPKNQYGHATSLAIWQGRVIVQLDQGDAGPANSRLMAFEGATGRVVWEKSRPVASSWATPIVGELAGKTQIITLGAPWVIGYSLADGAELWRAQLLEGEVTPSPIFAGGLVCAISPSSKLLAIKPDGTGDVTKTHLVWTSEESVPDVTSPATNGELIFSANGAGFMTCVDAKTGKKLWDHDLGFEVQASPGIAGDRVYVVSAGGGAAVVEAGREYKELGKGAIEDKFYASPAFVKGRIYLRGVANLWCIGEAAAAKK